MDQVAEYERRFRKAGLPLLTEDYSAAEDIFTRALPLLALIFLLEILGALKLDWRWWQNGLALVGGAVVAIISLGLLNARHGRRFLSVPQRVGLPELAAFVLVPALLPLIFGGQYRSSLVTISANLLILGIVWLVVGFGLISILGWVGRQFIGQLAASLVLMVRALPLLLFFALVTFFTNEYWQMFSTATTAKFAAALVLFLALAGLFLMVRIPQSVRELQEGSDLAGRPLRRAQRVNVGLIIFVSQALQVVFVALAVWLFFVAFGAVLVNAGIRFDWIGHPGHTVLSIPFFGDTVNFTKELLRTSTGVAAFSGLYYSVAMVVDSTFRDEFVERIGAQMRETFAARAEYLRLGGRAPVGAPSSPPRSSVGG